MNKRTATAEPPAPTFSADLLVKLAKCDPHAVDCLADWAGPSYFNPMIGQTPTATFCRLNPAFGFLHGLLDSPEGVSSEWQEGLALFVQTMWAAVQYEAFRQQGGEGGS